ncbi:hypothetical protein OG946_06450 [Streptomyces sp. NBC_01808]|uniref:hypothetical protein n=1 Tax=Streptomyces sp. NBC_01808 TaxID=2975947 RepID=UPI002DDC17C2|nr:hypothetical protein [Streptomyces sp. NBC_01808]WSA37047.1 hypothetical protein OG946_06450 [Streptomyces sp. NBC_01808]
MPLHGTDGDHRVRIPQPAAARDAARPAPRDPARDAPREPLRDAARPALGHGGGPRAAAVGPTRHLLLRLAEPARRAEARRLLALVLDVPPLPGVEPAVLIAEVPDGRRAVDVLIELAWAGIELDGFALDSAA